MVPAASPAPSSAPAADPAAAAMEVDDDPFADLDADPDDLAVGPRPGRTLHRLGREAGRLTPAQATRLEEELRRRFLDRPPGSLR